MNLSFFSLRGGTELERNLWKWDSNDQTFTAILLPEEDQKLSYINSEGIKWGIANNGKGLILSKSGTREEVDFMPNRIAPKPENGRMMVFNVENRVHSKGLDGE